MYTGCSYKRPVVPTNDRLFTGRLFWWYRNNKSEQSSENVYRLFRLVVPISTCCSDLLFRFYLKNNMSILGTTGRNNRPEQPVDGNKRSGTKLRKNNRPSAVKNQLFRIDSDSNETKANRFLASRLGSKM